MTWVQTIAASGNHPFITSGQSRESALLNARQWAPLSGNSGANPFLLIARDSDEQRPEKLFDALASFKVLTSQVAMHIDIDVRNKLFKQLDELIDQEEWDDNDDIPEISSYRTLLRTILIMNPIKIPGLGINSSGRLLAAWLTGPDRLTIECFPQDRLRWSLSVNDSGERRTAAAESHLKYFLDEIAPFGSKRWVR
jgi:hypothetical protein